MNEYEEQIRDKEYSECRKTNLDLSGSDGSLFSENSNQNWDVRHPDEGMTDDQLREQLETQRMLAEQEQNYYIQTEAHDNGQNVQFQNGDQENEFDNQTEAYNDIGSQMEISIDENIDQQINYQVNYGMDEAIEQTREAIMILEKDYLEEVDNEIPNNDDFEVLKQLHLERYGVGRTHSIKKPKKDKTQLQLIMRFPDSIMEEYEQMFFIYQHFKYDKNNKNQTERSNRIQEDYGNKAILMLEQMTGFTQSAKFSSLYEETKYNLTSYYTVHTDKQIKELVDLTVEIEKQKSRGNEKTAQALQTKLYKHKVLKEIDVIDDRMNDQREEIEKQVSIILKDIDNFNLCMTKHLQNDKDGYQLTDSTREAIIKLIKLTKCYYLASLLYCESHQAQPSYVPEFKLELQLLELQQFYQINFGLYPNFTPEVTIQQSTAFKYIQGLIGNQKTDITIQSFPTVKINYCFEHSIAKKEFLRNKETTFSLLVKELDCDFSGIIIIDEVVVDKEVEKAPKIKQNIDVVEQNVKSKLGEELLKYVMGQMSLIKSLDFNTEFMEKNIIKFRELCDILLNHNYTKEPLPNIQQYIFHKELDDREIEITKGKMIRYFYSQNSFIEMLKAGQYRETENGSLEITPERYPEGEEGTDLVIKYPRKAFRKANLFPQDKKKRYKYSIRDTDKGMIQFNQHGLRAQDNDDDMKVVSENLKFYSLYDCSPKKQNKYTVVIRTLELLNFSKCNYQFDTRNINRDSVLQYPHTKWQLPIPIFRDVLVKYQDSDLKYDYYYVLLIREPYFAFWDFQATIDELEQKIKDLRGHEIDQRARRERYQKILNFHVNEYMEKGLAYIFVGTISINRTNLELLTDPNDTRFDIMTSLEFVERQSSKPYRIIMGCLVPNEDHEDDLRSQTQMDWLWNNKTPSLIMEMDQYQLVLYGTTAYVSKINQTLLWPKVCSTTQSHYIQKIRLCKMDAIASKEYGFKMEDYLYGNITPSQLLSKDRKIINNRLDFSDTRSVKENKKYTIMYDGSYDFNNISLSSTNLEKREMQVHAREQADDDHTYKDLKFTSKVETMWQFIHVFIQDCLPYYITREKIYNKSKQHDGSRANDESDWVQVLDVKSEQANPLVEVCAPRDGSIIFRSTKNSNHPLTRINSYNVYGSELGKKMHTKHQKVIERYLEDLRKENEGTKSEELYILNRELYDYYLIVLEIKTSAQTARSAIAATKEAYFEEQCQVLEFSWSYCTGSKAILELIKDKQQFLAMIIRLFTQRSLFREQAIALINTYFTPRLVQGFLFTDADWIPIQQKGKKKKSVMKDNYMDFKISESGNQPLHELLGELGISEELKHNEIKQKYQLDEQGLKEDEILEEDIENEDDYYEILEWRPKRQ